MCNTLADDSVGGFRCALIHLMPMIYFVAFDYISEAEYEERYYACP